MNTDLKSRIESLDLLRGVAALSVAVSHFFLSQDPLNSIASQISVISVELFFVLSGFVLAPQIITCIAQKNFRTNIKTFLIRRWMRTIPPYLIALVCASLAFSEVRLADFFLYAFYVQNFFSQHLSQDYFFVAWSLSVEEWFYILFPALLYFLHKKIFKKHDFAFGEKYMISALMIISVIALCRYFFADQNSWGENVRRVVVFRLDSIAYGFIAYILILKLQKIHVIITTASAVIFFMIAFLLANQITNADQDVWKDGFLYASAGFGICTVTALYTIDSRASMRPKIFSRFCSGFGQASYSIYLFHSIVLSFIPMLPGLDLSLSLTVYCVVVVLFAYVFYRVIEKPILARRPHYKIQIPKL